MKRCEKCGVQFSGDLDRCPLCQAELSGDASPAVFPRNEVRKSGAIALAVLAFLIPSLLAWQSRKHNPQATYRVAGGVPALALVFTCGIVVIGVQFCIAAGLLPEVG